MPVARSLTRVRKRRIVYRYSFERSGHFLGALKIPVQVLLAKRCALALLGCVVIAAACTWLTYH